MITTVLIKVTGILLATAVEGLQLTCIFQMMDWTGLGAISVKNSKIKSYKLFI